jgi:hypothetical protein
MRLAFEASSVYFNAFAAGSLSGTFSAARTSRLTRGIRAREAEALMKFLLDGITQTPE